MELKWKCLFKSPGQQKSAPVVVPGSPLGRLPRVAEARQRAPGREPAQWARQPGTRSPAAGPGPRARARRGTVRIMALKRYKRDMDL